MLRVRIPGPKNLLFLIFTSNSDFWRTPPPVRKSWASFLPASWSMMHPYASSWWSSSMIHGHGTPVNNESFCITMHHGHGPWCIVMYHDDQSPSTSTCSTFPNWGDLVHRDKRETSIWACLFWMGTPQISPTKIAKHLNDKSNFCPQIGVLAIRTVTAGFAWNVCVGYARLCWKRIFLDPFRDIFSFQLRTRISGKPFFVLTPINQGYPQAHGPNSGDLCLRNSSLGWGTTSWLLARDGG